jgi:glycosyltransferase involved in cell wall biosynthesis
MKKDRRLRILWSSNAPWAHSGYSVQSRDLLYRFLKDGWKVAGSFFYGLEGGMITVNGLKCYPKMGQPWGSDACYYHQQDFNADCVITFQNPWPMNINLLHKIKNWIAYVPIEFDPPNLPNIQRLNKAYRLISLSRFGKKALEKVGLQSELILEAVDTDVFKPMDKMALRKELGLPEDVFLFGMVAANKDNPPRKCFQHCIDAFVRFNKKHPKSAMYFHVLLQQQGGFPIQDYANYLKINKKIFFTPPYNMMFKSPHPVISKIMNTFDVLLNPSSGEGFGLPIVEAQSVGVPVVVSNWTAQTELVKEGITGEICDHTTPKWVNLQTYSAEPDLDSLYDRMEKVYKYARDEKTKKACRKHIVEGYDMNTRVKETWIPFLEKLQLELLGEPKKEKGVVKDGTH